jgi:hypothetical protein
MLDFFETSKKVDDEAEGEPPHGKAERRKGVRLG